MIEPGKLNGYLVAIKEELRKAEGKHPKFCDELLDPESRVSRITTTTTRFSPTALKRCWRRFSESDFSKKPK